MGVSIHTLRWRVKQAKDRLKAPTIDIAAIKLGWLDLKGYDQ